MTRRAQVLLAAFLICLSSVQSALADPVAPPSSSAVALIHVPIEILVASSQGDMHPLFRADVSAGDTLRGTLSYDINAMGTVSGNARIFDQIGGSIALHVGSGLTLPLSRIDVYDTIPNGSPFDSDTVAAFSSTMSFPGFDYIEATLDFQGPPASRTTSALPTSAAEIAAFYTSGSFRFLAFQTGKEAPFDDGTQSFIGRARLSDTTAVTPEPATLLLVLPFAIGLRWRRPRASGAGRAAAELRR